MMQPLDKTLRNQLEKTVREAREIAEDAARAALEQLGVCETAPFAHLSGEERDLRCSLRAHGRQLGDPLNGGKIQTMDRLAEEVAYEHWHRMLFARYLAENGLLMYWPENDEDPIDIDLETCQGLLDDGEEQAGSVWELAARYAARMLPQIFRPDSPVFRLALPPEHQHKLERLLAGLPPEVFTASDSLGWVYQFWQAKKKDEVNTSEVKIGARELPAVTQLFTEPYMVSFLLDNSLGAWWAARRLSEADLQNAGSEEELRRKASLPGMPLEYLRFVRQEDGLWAPAAGTFGRWPENPADFRVLDPCCGSGHFLVAAFLMLVPLRMELEGLSAKDAADAVLRQNIHGLDIDRRVTEIAAFALALAAWKCPGAGGYRTLPELHLACSGLSVTVAREEWKQLGLGRKNLTLALGWIHDVFQDAPLLGSLLDPAKTDAANLVRWEDLSGLVEQALRSEGSEQRQEAAVVAQGLAKAAALMAGQYHLVITNVPYLARGRQDDTLRDFCEERYPEAKNDLATVFLERCLRFCAEGGTSSVVLPQNWLFLTSYRKFREKLLKNDTWHLIARLGAGAFETISGEVVKAILFTISRSDAAHENGAFFGDAGKGSLIRGVDVSEFRTAGEKASWLPMAEIKTAEQAKQLENPDFIIQLDVKVASLLFAAFASCYQGTSTGDNLRFLCFFWEIKTVFDSWCFLETVPGKTQHFGGKNSAIKWQDVNSYNGSAIRGLDAFGKKGVAVGQMVKLPATFFLGQRFSNTTPVIIPKKEADLPSTWVFCMSESFSHELRKINQKLSVDNGYVGKIPFDLDRWSKVAAEKYPHGLPGPYTDDPTQWIFHGHPCGSVLWDEVTKRTAHGPLRTGDTVLQIAVARLLGYRWPAELDGGMELADEQREWVNRCEALLPCADGDGIVCIPPVRGELPASDRLLDLLAAAYGDAWSGDVLAELLKNADHAGKTLETWLREKFFTQHCRIFQHRPFIWHIWDGLRDGFAALVNYHRLDRKKMETLIYTYLGDWINRQKQEMKAGTDGAEERLAAAERLKKRLEVILEGEAPFDIFVRWKPLDQQPIGWNPDLNDGVRLNIRPFLTVPDVGKRGAGILRDKPNINWNKDRGKDVASAPWHHLFHGDRINDHHLTLAEKQRAREAAE
jgi:hypothetical protein